MALTKRQRVFLWIGVVLIIAMCIVPPWRAVGHWQGKFGMAETYRPIFFPSVGAGGEFSANIDMRRLLVQVFAVGLLTAAFMCVQGKTRRHEETLGRAEH